MKSETTKQFRSLLAALPESVQRQARQAYQLFQNDPYHPSLHFKRLTSTDPTLYSVRIGRRYRAIGQWEGDAIAWVWIGAHAEYDRIVDNL